jgi:hypothetical protein
VRNVAAVRRIAPFHASNKVGWTGQYRIARSHHGRTILSPALGVMIGFIIWVVIISASIIFYSST